jgi:phosphonate transport system ATP-binding protein
LVHPRQRPPALAGVDLRVAPGERVALIGASGAGKTTLLRVLAASLRPGSGRVELLGSAPWDARRGLPAAGAHRRVHQAPPIPPRQRVVTAVLAGRLGQWPLWKSLASLVLPVDPEGARRELARLDLAERLYDRCDRLSGGQLQRVALARVLYQQPDLLLADEPVSAMDPASPNSPWPCSTTRPPPRRDPGGEPARGGSGAAPLPGVVEGRAILFDLPAAEVSEALLRELYAAEGGLPLAGAAAARSRPGGRHLPPLRCA